MAEVFVLFNGYSEMVSENEMKANCTCTLIKSQQNVIIDTMTPWDTDRIQSALKQHNITPENIHFLVSTHGHSDHIGNNNLFLAAKHIVGYSISSRDIYLIHNFDKGEEYKINDNIKLIPTPGHTLQDVSVIVSSPDKAIIAITGDLFERYEDIDDPSIWLEAGSDDCVKQRINRSKVADMSDWIIPGHGPKFKVTRDIRETLRGQLNLID